MSAPMLDKIKVCCAPIRDREKYPFSIPIIKNLQDISLPSPVTFFVGENGTGKSSLLEAIAYKAGFGLEGGSKNMHFTTSEEETVELFKKPKVWERKSSHAPYTLVYKEIGYRSSEAYGEPTQVEFYIRHDASGKEDLLVDVTQANLDHNGRLIMALYGALLGCDLLHEPLQAQVLVDFNDQTPPTR